MGDSMQEQKNKKKQSIMEAAYDCFIKYGVHKTSIDEIVRGAKVAKGTFYLYFQDKNDVLQQLSVYLSQQIIRNAYREVQKQQLTDYLDIVICFVDNIIEYFRRNKLVLKLIGRNFSWPLLESKLSSAEEDLQEIMEVLLNNPHQPVRDREEVYRYLFSIISLCAGVAYSSIVDSQPADIDEMKPVLYHMIRKILM